ncbi:GNAT family N-acetyltransferase [Streptomyces sp. NPDC056527]|uniref:GNAT family N-acetyltransferase n=1 Tax=Streptomyces sp. NPDC056527 TaxID=3345853 RepID=UPI0036754AD9
MTTITHLSPEAFGGAVDGLADVLADAVASGASLGFLQPFGHEAAVAWWHTRRLEPKANGRHRAEIVKLMVHRRARGHGLARRLLSTAEQAAQEAGVTLLLLDTETDSTADRLYATTGWTRFGEVPAYATDPTGALQDCSFFYKALMPS